MMKTIILFTFLVSVSTFAQEEDSNPYTPTDAISIDDSVSVDQPISTDLVGAPKEVKDGPLITTDLPEPIRKFDHRKSHWLFNFGFEGLKYELPWEFSGEKESFKPKDQELWGGRLGFGGSIYLGKGINTTTKVDGFFMGTLFSRTKNAGPDDESEEFAYVKRTGQIYGLEISQSLGWMFDLKTKNPFLDEWTFLVVEPFIEAGLGRAWAYNRVNYNYNTGSSGTNEGYRESFQDEILNTKIGGGVNFTANTGYFFYMKAFVNNFDILERKNTRYVRPDQGSGSTNTRISKSAKLDPVTTIGIGGGYKF